MLVLGTILRRRNWDYIVFAVLGIMIMKIDGKRDFCNDFWRNASYVLLTTKRFLFKLFDIGSIL